MSGFFDYTEARRLAMEDVPFDALIFAAMLRADLDNYDKLRAGWPELADELDRRHHRAAGRLPEDGPVAS